MQWLSGCGGERKPSFHDDVIAWKRLIRIVRVTLVVPLNKDQQCGALLFPLFYPEQIVQQTVEMALNSDATTLIWRLPLTTYRSYSDAEPDRMMQVNYKNTLSIGLAIIGLVWLVACSEPSHYLN